VIVFDATCVITGGYSGATNRRCRSPATESLEDRGHSLREPLAVFMLDVACPGPGAAMKSLTRSPDLSTRIHGSMRGKVPFLWIFGNDLAGFGGSDPSSDSFVRPSIEAGL